MASARVESLKFLIPIAVVIFLVLLLPGLASGILSAILLLLFAGTFYFFRDPERQPPSDPSVIVSSADGLVTHVETVEAPFNLGKMQRVSVFLSVFDVHVNRVPYGGTITESVHTPGQFLDARANDCATQNERMDWLFQTERGPLVVRQIAGLIARRIVGWAKPQETVLTGQRLGMIRFGSRTDLFLPANTEVLVKIGDRVQGSLTPLARWTDGGVPSSPSAFEALISPPRT